MNDETDRSAMALVRDGVSGPFPPLADRETIGDLAHFFERVLKERTVQPLYGRYSLRDWHLVVEPLRDLLTSRRLIDCLATVTGASSLILWRSKLFEKLPGAGPVDWHQEYGYFDGEEVGGHRPSLYPLGAASPWCWTVWLALTDVTPEDGVMEFVVGSQDVRYATRMVPLTRSGAFGYIDPRQSARTKEELVERAGDNALILDVDTRDVFVGVDVADATLGQLLDVLQARLDTQQAVVTEAFQVEPESARIYPMIAGQYIVFNQRTMHRSRASGPSGRLRLAMSARYTLGTTLVYPQRGYDSLDGSNLDINGHKCIRVCGNHFNEANAYLDLP